MCQSHSIEVTSTDRILSPKCIHCWGSKQAIVQIASPLMSFIEDRVIEGPLVCEPSKTVEFEEVVRVLSTKSDRSIYSIKEIWCTDCGVQYSVTALRLKFN